jgi:hypothetical protein
MTGKQENREFICKSDDLPGWVWIRSGRTSFLIPKSRAQEEGLL